MDLTTKVPTELEVDAENLVILGGTTIAEYGELMGIKYVAAAYRLRKLVAAGKAERGTNIPSGKKGHPTQTYVPKFTTTIG